MLLLPLIYDYYLALCFFKCYLFDEDNNNKLRNLINLHLHLHSDDRLMENKSLPSSTDEGFEDSHSGDFTKSPQLSQVPLIDFHKPKENPHEKVITFIQESIILNILYIYLN